MGCDHSPEGVANKIVRKATKKLDLNQEQVNKLEQIKVAALEQYELRQQRRDERKEVMKKFILSEKLVKNDVQAQMDERRALFEDNFDRFFPLIQDFHASLNPDQKQKLLEFADKIQNRRKHW